MGASVLNTPFPGIAVRDPGDKFWCTHEGIRGPSCARWLSPVRVPGKKHEESVRPLPAAAVAARGARHGAGSARASSPRSWCPTLRITGTGVRERGDPRSVTDLQMGEQFAVARAGSYAQVATTSSVVQPVVDRLHLEETPAVVRREGPRGHQPARTRP
ncbi:hypothetical protein QJS66_07860 [Kocuria rhizophila]|nr:hypothetical protein QJS66_07860 [Kocuria rhizophila]